ncbi:MAG: hypothetical protein A2381_01060 [Bdellovibrionales bacterium RIFOXYB1_FULL_37_110]|nr:MAG: hypothetical protein A2417_01915 [Bdellovibrionales bacterium RIFOXYC1_FULL_37_79]OFZ58807.1 MAG: hypothetical protein A2381_01060 [Bdellovibrionales bacterium RIFOXYB1_FULL_37_110]OFZ64806.1 MAG: hypothetical protein A2577_07060 [Bdellovibrionales bacterium RIFOXYD1_FULL_36_51]
MKILFLVERNLYYKFYGPIIEGLLKCGCEIHLLHRYDQTTLSYKNQKMFYYPFLSQVPQFSKKVEFVSIFRTNEEIVEYIKKFNIEYVFSLSSRGQYKIKKTMTKWCTVQHGVDSFKERSFDSDFFFVYSRNWIRADIFKYNEDVKIVEVGMYYCEEFSKGSVARKYNLDENKKYIFFVPLPVNTSSAYTFIKGGLRRFCLNKFLIKNELEILKFLKSELQGHGYEIIVKSRFKRFLSEEYNKFANIFYDESFYPSSVNELLSTSEATIVNFMPGAISTEASFYNKKFIFLNYPKYNSEVFSHADNYIKDIYFPGPKEDFIHLYSNKQALLNSILGKSYYDSSDYRLKFIGSNKQSGVDIIIDKILNMNII